MLRFTIHKADEYREWEKTQTPKSQRQIEGRLAKIEQEGYFGHRKDVGEYGLEELKFNDGRRIYYAILQKTKVLLLLGGNKNGQDKDIKKAESLLRKIIQVGSF